MATDSWCGKNCRVSECVMQILNKENVEVVHEVWKWKWWSVKMPKLTKKKKNSRSFNGYKDAVNTSSNSGDPWRNLKLF